MRGTIIIGILLLCLAEASVAKSWEQSIRDVSLLAEKYRSFAHDRGTTYAGTLYNTHHVRRHECAVLGRLLGKLEEVRHLEEMDLPAITEDLDPHTALVTSMSLFNWVGAARSGLAASEEERIYFWNVNCVGKEGIPEAHLAANAPVTRFEQRGSLLIVRGPVEKGFSEALDGALDIQTGVNTVVLGSGGGNVMEALKAGRIIRARGLGTSLGDNCYSACPLVFLGGVDRTLFAGSNRLGFHQVSIRGVPIPREHEVYQIIHTYAAEMGADGAWLVNTMLATPPNKMHYAEPDSLCGLGIATFIQYWCN